MQLYFGATSGCQGDLTYLTLPVSGSSRWSWFHCGWVCSSGWWTLVVAACWTIITISWVAAGRTLWSTCPQQKRVDKMGLNTQWSTRCSFEHWHWESLWLWAEPEWTFRVILDFRTWLKITGGGLWPLLCCIVLPTSKMLGIYDCWDPSQSAADRKVAVRKGPSIDCHVLGAYEQGQQLMLFATGPKM